MRTWCASGGSLRPLLPVLESEPVGRCEEAIGVIFGRVQADVIVPVPGWDRVAVRNPEQLLPGDKMMVARIEMHPVTVRGSAHARIWNFLAIATILVAAAAGWRICPCRVGFMGGNAVPRRKKDRDDR